MAALRQIQQAATVQEAEDEAPARDAHQFPQRLLLATDETEGGYRYRDVEASIGNYKRVYTAMLRRDGNRLQTLFMYWN